MIYVIIWCVVFYYIVILLFNRISKDYYLFGILKVYEN